MKKFHCAICNQDHEFSEVLRFGMPKKYLSKMYVDELTYESDERWFIIDDKYYFVRGILTIPIFDLKDDFSWIVWIEVDENDFFSFIEELSLEGEIKNHKGEGELFLDVAFVGAKKGVEVLFNFTSLDSFPTIEIVDKNLGLNKFVENGISKENAIKIMSSVYH